jgi:hypothetical protein
MGSVTHTPKAGALLTGAEYEASNHHIIALDASDIPSHTHAYGPDSVDYLVGTASAGLSGEIVVGTSPGGELGGTWASPTVDASHSGSTHAATQAAAEATAAAYVASHEADTTNVHGIANTANLSLTSHTHTFSLALTFIIDGGGSAITTGIKGDIEVPFAGTITAARLFADQTGSIVIDLWKDTYGNFPPTVADTITASAKPTLSTASKSQDSTLTGWTTSITAGDIIRVNVDSITTCTRVTLSLTVSRTV